MPALRVLEMATRRGAAALGMEDEIGSIEPGKKADIVLLDLRKPHASPSTCVDPVSRVVYSAHSSDVVMTIVDGQVVYEGGQLTNIDEGEVLNRCDEAIVRLARRAGIAR
jgi:cytosine/adenosine deaminase-related metal-dependent hydrolase